MQYKETAKKLFAELESSFNIDYQNRIVNLSKHPVWQKIQEENIEVRRVVSLEALRQMSSDNNYHYSSSLWKNVFKSELHFKEELPQAFLRNIFEEVKKFESFFHLPDKLIIEVLSYYKEHFGDDEFFRDICKWLANWYKGIYYPDVNFKRFIAEVDKILNPELHEYPFSIKDITGKELEKIWNKANQESRDAITFCWDEKYRSKPTKTWLKKARLMVASTQSKDEQSEMFSGIFDWLTETGTDLVKRLNKEYASNEFELNHDFYYNKHKYFSAEDNENGLCFLIWYASLLGVEKVNSSIGRLATASLNKIKGKGSLSTRNGNAAMLGFTFMPEKFGIINLLKIRNKTVNKNIKKQADGHIRTKATELGLTEEALLELSTPDFGLVDYQVRQSFGDFTGIIETPDIKKPLIKWLKNDSNSFQKSIPKAVRDDFKEELKAFKTLHKELGEAFSTHIRRLENTYVEKIEWELTNWKGYYIDHPFLSRFNSLLIWWFDESISAIFHEGEWTKSNGEKVDINQFEKVKLWHPIYDEVEAVVEWRNFLIEREIKQPFKQAFREVYRVTDAELTTDVYSNRFAAHIIYQYQFAALARQRNWDYSLQGTFDSHNRPTRKYAGFDCYAEFWVEPIHDTVDGQGLFTYLATDQVRVYNQRDRILMADVPEMLFTELMRDVDLFVGVCSVGNNPEWQDGGEQGTTYWQEYSFGLLSATAQTRKEVLESILPKLKIAKQCKLNDRFLEVEGKIRNYKIHLGSGNILMSPNDEYLCIVPDSRKKNDEIYLPFDGDRTLSIVISKAFLLAADDKIKDKTILRQIQL